MGVAAMYAPAVLLAYACVLSKISAVPTTSEPITAPTATETFSEKLTSPIKYQNSLVPEDKIYFYKYSAEVSVGQHEPASYASKFKIQGRFALNLESNLGSSLPTYYMKFNDVQHTMYNGNENNESSSYQPLESFAKEFEEPFLVTYDHTHRVKSLKMSQNESGWSKNMKKAIAAVMAATNLIQFQMDDYKAIFNAWEDTISGSCPVEYSVHKELEDGKKMVYVDKTYSPMTCSKYTSLLATDHGKSHCPKLSKNHLVSSAGRTYKFEFSNGHEFFLRKITTWEKTSYVPIADRNVGVQHMEVQQTFDFERTYEKTEIHLPDMDSENSIRADGVVFEMSDLIKSTPTGASVEGMNFIRSPKSSQDLVSKAKGLLVKMMDYSSINHIEKQHSTLGYDGPSEELFETLSYMNSSDLNVVFQDLSTLASGPNTVRRIFLSMVSRVGTIAAWEFSANAIRNADVDEEKAIEMLRNLPQYIINPNMKLAIEMQSLKNLDPDKVSSTVKQAAILAYSILLRKIYDNYYTQDFFDEERTKMKYFWDNQTKDFFERLKNETVHQEKVLYLMALKNMQHQSFEMVTYLREVVGGYTSYPGAEKLAKSHRYRMAAMWALRDLYHTSRGRILEIFWPILSDVSLPTEMRILAYEFLVTKNHALDMQFMMRVHWLMQNEKNHHLYNYHYTTLKGMAHTTDPCNQDSVEIMKNVLRLTNRRKTVASVLSQSTLLDYYDDKMDYGKVFKMAAVVNEDSGIPQFGFIEISSIYQGKKSLGTGFYWNIDGINYKNIQTLIENFDGSKAQSEPSVFEIRDEKVKNLLQKVQGYKAIQRDLHLEVWEMYNGYVTNVHAFSEKSLIDFVQKNAGTYNPSSMNDFEFFQYDLVNQYKMILPTDVGLPAVFYNQAPNLGYIKIKPKIASIQPTLVVGLQIDIKAHIQRLYEMKVYNPFVGSTHSVQRRVTTDVALPFDASISVNYATNVVKVVLPRMPESEFSTAGVRIHALEQVMVVNDEGGHLQTLCPSCQHRAAIVSGSPYDSEHVLQSVDTGLEFTSATRNCYVNDMSYVEQEAWHKMLNEKSLEANQNILAYLMMTMDRRKTFVENFPYVGTCERFFKASPSKKYPTSQVEMNWRFGTLKSGKKTLINVRGTLESKAVSTNAIQSKSVIDMEFGLDKYEGHLDFKLLNKREGEQGLNVCVNAEKTYPNPNAHTSLHETNFKLVYAMSYSDDGNCNNNGTRVEVNGKGELLDEQKQHLEKLIESGKCFKSSSIPLEWDVNKRLDWNCLYEAIEATSLRKYSYDITYEKVSPGFLGKLSILESSIRNLYDPHVSYASDHAELGNIKVNLTFNRKDNHADITITNPYFTYIMHAFLLDADEDDAKSIALAIDNTDFSFDFLQAFASGELRPCIAHSDELVTDLNETIPYNFHDWTLMSGDYATQAYAVFAKAVDGGRVAVRIYTGNHVLELSPGESEPIMKIDDEVVPDYMNRKVPWESPKLEWKVAGNLFMVEAGEGSKVKVIYTPYNVIVRAPALLGRYIDGVCGHMGSMAYEQAPLIYSST